MRHQKLFFLLIFALIGNVSFSQETTIKGFVDVNALYVESTKNASMNLGEQDLFIASELTDKISFLGEIVFKFDGASATKFGVGVERVILKYNYKDNHNILVGKHHTPINYWNDSYHHGRVFFPTVLRPQLFNATIIPLHTTGISFQGSNLTKFKLGYDVMIGNGIGSSDILDNDKPKSLTVALHSKPYDGMRIGFSYYYDAIDTGVKYLGTSTSSTVFQSLYNGSITYFHPKAEFLLELTYADNKAAYNDKHYNTIGSYVHIGYRIKKFVLYTRLDQIGYADKDPYFVGKDINIVTGGVRYEISYITVIKAEYQSVTSDDKTSGFVNLQFAVGF